MTHPMTYASWTNGRKIKSLNIYTFSNDAFVVFCYLLYRITIPGTYNCYSNLTVQYPGF